MTGPGKTPGAVTTSGSGWDGARQAPSSTRRRRTPARKAGRDRSSSAGHTEPNRHFRRSLRKQGPQACRPGAGEAQTAPNGHAGPQCIARDLLVFRVASTSRSLVRALPLCPISCCGLSNTHMATCACAFYMMMVCVCMRARVVRVCVVRV